MLRKVTGSDTATKMLDVAQRLVQKRGFNGFSYADIAESLKVSKASLHYHFASKAELGTRLIERYERVFAEQLDIIDAECAGAPAKLNRYLAIYAGVLRNKCMCLCGMLAAESHTLPKPMRKGLDRFFLLNERWLTITLEEGRDKGQLGFEGSAAEAANFLVGALEGCMMLAYSQGNADRFDTSAARLLAEFGVDR